MSKPPALMCAARSDIGLVRSRNEDSLWVDTRHGWLLLADGMGGHKSGDLASALTVSYVLDKLKNTLSLHPGKKTVSLAHFLIDGLKEANSAIRAAAAQTATDEVMGSTFVGALVEPDRIEFVYLGDSRLYLLRKGELTQLSRDHTLVQEFVDSGRLSEDMAQNHPYRGLLTRGLGVHDNIGPETGSRALRPGDRLLLCSDGLTDMVEPNQIAALMGTADSVEEVANSLIDAAKMGGGRDNISVIVAWFAHPGDASG